MNKALALARVLKKCGNESTEEKNSGHVESLAFLCLGVIAAVLLFFLGRTFGRFAIILGDPMTFIQLLFMIGALISLFFVFPSVINQLYMSNDLSVLLTLPYSSSQIVMARLINLIRLPVAICLVTTLPVVIGYASRDFSFSLILAGLLAAICEPIIVLSFVGIVTIAIMSNVKGVRNKDLLRTVGIILLFLVFVGITALTKQQGTGSAMDFGKLIASIGHFNNVLPINFALGALMKGFSLLAVLEILGITAAFALVFLLLISRFYLNGALAMQETSAGKGLVSGAQMEQFNRKRSLVAAYTEKELKSVSREPAYLMNGFLYTIVFPLVWVFINGASDMGIPLKALHTANGLFCYLLLMVPLITFLAASANAIAASSFSREGSSFGILKTMPLSPLVILKAKRNAALVVCGCGSTLYVIVGGLLLFFLGYMPIWGIAYGLLLNIPLLIFIVDTNMLHDIKKINLNWESEAQMLKTCTGAASLIMMIVGLIVPLFGATMMYYVSDMIPWLVPLVAVAAPVAAILMGYIQEKRLQSKGMALLGR